MGKGTIISGGTDGQYQLQVNYNRVAYDAEIAKLANQITEYTTKISDKESEITTLENEKAYLISNQFTSETIAEKTNEITKAEKEKATLTIYKLSFEKRKQYLENNMPDDETRSAWCADLTETLTGEVGTVEVPGESTYIQIQPGYEGNATYNQTRDGQLLPIVVSTPAQTFYNLAMLPGWQKWKPLFRYATITAINGSTADITFENIKSSQQALEVNQTSTITNVSIEYMSCDGGAFDVGDKVLVKFTPQAWESPVIVGFKDNPKPCGTGILRIQITYFVPYESQYIYFDMAIGTIRPLLNPVDNSELEQPISTLTYTSAQIANIESYNNISDTASPGGLSGLGDVEIVSSTDCDDASVTCTSYIYPSDGGLWVDEDQPHIEWGHTKSMSSRTYNFVGLEDQIDIVTDWFSTSDDTVGDYSGCPEGSAFSNLAVWEYDRERDVNANHQIYGRRLASSLSNGDSSALVSLRTYNWSDEGHVETKNNCANEYPLIYSCDMEYRQKMGFEVRSYLENEGSVLSYHDSEVSLIFNQDTTIDAPFSNFPDEFIEYDENTNVFWGSAVNQELGCMGIVCYCGFFHKISAPDWPTIPDDEVEKIIADIYYVSQTPYKNDVEEYVFSLAGSELKIISNDDLNTLFGSIPDNKNHGWAIKIYKDGE